MDKVVLQSPAKLNLYLKVINKRKDGYHNISTLFERIDLSDTLSFCKNKSGKIHISCNHPHVPTGKKNLVYKIAEFLRNDFDIKEGADISIDKNIPVAAGLAGGSSNAATALLGLNKLWDLRLKKNQLLKYARNTGSDVAFFLHNTSWGLGSERGDVIKRINNKNKLYHILVVPRVKMYSSVVYSGIKLQLTKVSDNVSILIHNLRKSNILKSSELLINDLEQVIFDICPNLLQLKERLKLLGFQGVMVSGSGPAVFGLANSKKQAEEAKDILSKRYSQVFVVKTF